jgi:hypothetical protein
MVPAVSLTSVGYRRTDGVAIRGTCIQGNAAAVDVMPRPSFALPMRWLYSPCGRV